MYKSAGLCYLLLLFMSLQAIHAQNTDIVLAKSQQLHPEMKLGRNSDIENKENLKKTIALDIENLDLIKALEQVVAKTDLSLSYGMLNIPTEKKVTLQSDQITVNEALWKILGDIGL